MFEINHSLTVLFRRPFDYRSEATGQFHLSRRLQFQFCLLMVQSEIINQYLLIEGDGYRYVPHIEGQMGSHGEPLCIEVIEEVMTFTLKDAAHWERMQEPSTLEIFA